MKDFKEAVRQRKKANQDALFGSTATLSNLIRRKEVNVELSQRDLAEHTALAVLMSFGINDDGRVIPNDIADVNAALDYRLRPYGVERRAVRLEGRWYLEAAGTIVARKKESGKPVVMVPGIFRGYVCKDMEKSRAFRITEKNSGDFEPKAFTFYRTFPAKPLSEQDVIEFALTGLRSGDVALFFVSVLLSALCGAALPVITRLLFTSIVPFQNVSALTYTAVLALSLIASHFLIDSIDRMLLKDINQRASYMLYEAAMMRICSLQSSFFRGYSAADLSTRAALFRDVFQSYSDLVIRGLINAVAFIVSTAVIFIITPELLLPAVICMAASLAVVIISIVCQQKNWQKQLLFLAKNNTDTFSIVKGMSKIRLTASEERMFAKWSASYAMEARLKYDPPFIVKTDTVLLSAIAAAGTICFYITAVNHGLAPADFYAFTSAFAAAGASIVSYSAVSGSASKLFPAFTLIHPIMDAQPETETGKKNVKELKGEIELSHVTFSYDSDVRPVVDDLSLHVHPGDYIAICGASGCGKSTLVRLLLGFERPDAGVISYDNYDMTQVDVRSLRKNIGTVLQNGKLVAGSIFENIGLYAENFTEQEAWEAARLAGIADTIRELPMQMNTYISEGAGGISGGQKQRIMIARALAARPSILIFDEATSALDNVTQKQVSDAIDSLPCTRIVVAHRLSTIRNCKRILLLADGKIREDGTYEELMAKNGLFAKLVEKQQIE